MIHECERKLRSTEKTYKEKVVAAELSKREALEKVNAIETESKRKLQVLRQQINAEIGKRDIITGTLSTGISYRCFLLFFFLNFLRVLKEIVE